MKQALVSALVILGFSGCTVYRSEGRKQFESEAPQKAQVSSTAAFQLKKCKKEGRLEAWFNEEFPSHTYELLVAESDLEIWRTYNGSTVEVKAIQKVGNATYSCLYEFSNDIVWNMYKEQFIRELEDNVMTVE